MNYIIILAVLLGSLLIYMSTYYTRREIATHTNDLTFTERYLRIMSVAFFWWLLMFHKALKNQHPKLYRIIGAFIMSFALMQLFLHSDDPATIILILPLSIGLILLF